MSESADEVSSAGFWPGGGAIEYPAFYSYAYPAPEAALMEFLQSTYEEAADLGKWDRPRSNAGWASAER